MQSSVRHYADPIEPGASQKVHENLGYNSIVCPDAELEMPRSELAMPQHVTSIFVQMRDDPSSVHLPKDKEDIVRVPHSLESACFSLEMLRRLFAHPDKALTDSSCVSEERIAVGLSISLIVMITATACAVAFLRSERVTDAQVKPICRPLASMNRAFRFTLVPGSSHRLDVVSVNGALICSMVITAEESSGPKATSYPTGRLDSAPAGQQGSQLLASVIERTLLGAGPTLVICAASHAIFAFVCPEAGKMHLRHRLGRDLMTIVGNFLEMNLTVTDPDGETIASFSNDDGILSGEVAPNIDAAVVLLGVLAGRLYTIRRADKLVEVAVPGTVEEEAGNPLDSD